jgi:tetratricopeptide (TPR) repeat protein
MKTATATAIWVSICAATCAPAAAAAARARIERVESVDECIARGREALRAKHPEDALKAFEQAAQLDGSTPKSRVWVARGWIALGRFDEALQAADELKQAKAPAADVDYLLGLAFAGLAKASLAQRGSQYTQGQFDDATSLLERATKADAKRYADAWLPLAEAAWYSSRLELARDAAQKAVALDAQDPSAHIALGKVAFSQFSAAQGGEDKSAGDPHWKTASEAFTKAIALLGNARDPASVALLFDAHLQTAYLHQWKQDNKKAAEHYAIAASLSPGGVDFNQVRGALGADFEACMAEALAKFRARHGDDEPAAATLHWWYGFALFENAKAEPSEAEFRRAVQLFPGYTNSWYYVFRARYAQQDYEQAIEALKTFWRLDQDGLVNALAADPDLNLRIVEYLIGWCANPEQHAGEALNADAALMSEVLTRVKPEQPRYWNNLGLFLRDQGDVLRMKDKDADPAELTKLWEGAYAAYSKTLELEPNNPNYLNDTAVMLHYYFKRDYERALAMYEKAAKAAEELLARKDLPADERAVIQIAKRDSNNNIAKVKRIMEKLSKGEKLGPEDEDQ